MPPGIKRQQGDGLEGHLNTRQDRNTVLSGGGTLTWDAGTGTLTWSNTLNLSIPGLSAFTIAANTQAGITLTGHAVYVVISRTSGGGALSTAVALFSSTNFYSDERFVLAERGPDGKLYFRNGTVFNDGDSKTFGALNSVTDRSEVTYAANPVNVGFSFVNGSDQLAVYVGGILQIKGTHYNETGTTQVTFLPGYVPTAGELITFINIVGGEGPPGAAGSLQQAYDGGTPTIDVVPGSPVQLDATAGVAATVLAQAGNAASTGALAAWNVNRAGVTTANERKSRSAGGDTSHRADTSGNAITHSTSAPYRGVRVDKAGGIQHGVFPPGGPDTVYGALQWRTFSGTTSAVGPTTVATGLIGVIKGVMVSVENALTGLFQTAAFGPASAATKFHVTFDDTTGDVTLSLDPDGTGTLPADLQGQAYRMVVFL